LTHAPAIRGGYVDRDDVVEPNVFRSDVSVSPSVAV
jgi:hypothetical protein